MPAKQRSGKKIQNDKPIEKLESDENDGILSRIDFKRLLIRMVMIGGIMFAVYINKQDEVVTFAPQTEDVNIRSIEVPCSKDYVEEIHMFSGCAPKRCGRVVFDRVISLMEVLAMKNIAERGIGMGGSLGGASILDLHSGALSLGKEFINIYKMDSVRKVFTDQDFLLYSSVKNKIKRAIADHFELDYDHLYLTHPTFFSKITPAPAKTMHDEYWHPHVDKETYESFHYTSLLYLSDYKRDFDGGRFIFIDPNGNKTVEPRSGRVSAFTSGSENLHRVEQVKKGTRYAITVSFTCDPKHSIQDPKLPPS